MSIRSDAAAGTFLKMTSEIEFTAGGQWSFSALLYIETLSSPITIFTKRNSTGGFPFVFRFCQYEVSPGGSFINSVGLSNSDGTTVRHWNVDSGTTFMINTALPDMQQATWYHVGVTCDNDNLIDATTTTVRHFVNGAGYDLVRDPSGGTPLSLADPNVVCSLLGPAAGLTATHLNGRIAQIGIWTSRKLSNAEMADLGGVNGAYSNPMKYGPNHCFSGSENGSPNIDRVAKNNLIWTGAITLAADPANLMGHTSLALMD